MKKLRVITPKKIIVRMPNWIGDLVMAIPVLHDLRKYYPNAHLAVMCKAPLEELLRYEPCIDEIVTFKKAHTLISRYHLENHIVRTLHKGKYDLGILLTNSWSSAWWFWQADILYRLGYQGNWRSKLLTHAVKISPNKEKQHQVLTYKELLRPLGIIASSTSPSLVVKAEEITAAYQKLGEYGVLKQDIIVGINPGAAYGSAKCWIPERFREVVQGLLQLNSHIKVVVFGDAQGASIVKEICRVMSRRVIDLSSKTTLRELMALIKVCDAFLTNDSGPMHMADALGSPLLALFGSTSSIKTGPFIQKNVLQKQVSCSPCYRRECPIDFKCMKSISSQEVYEKIVQLLQRTHHDIVQST